MNQCDGCRLGVPIVNGLHVMFVPGHHTMNKIHCGCTAHMYPPERHPQYALKYVDGKLVEVEHKTVFGLLVSVGGLGA